LLTTRRELLVERLAERDGLIAQTGVRLPRVTLLETEYLHAQTEAEIRWIDTVLDGLRDGSLTWGASELHQAADRLEG
jgi:hypothetical protein